MMMTTWARSASCAWLGAIALALGLGASAAAQTGSMDAGEITPPDPTKFYKEPRWAKRSR